MKRMRAMMGMGRFQLLVVMAAVVLAAGLVVGSGASFTAHTANAGNIFSTGTLNMSNTPSGMSTEITNMVPGDFHTGSVVIKNTGDVEGHFYLQPVVITGSTKLADQCDLLIKDGSTVVYDGKLSGLAQEDLGTWDANETHTYDFKVTFPDQVADALKDISPDNQYMGLSVTAGFDWTAVTEATGSR
ncbi:MAG: TasA family protein [Coriobacteriia bacterium]